MRKSKLPVRIEFLPASDDLVTVQEVHLLPCHIKYSGPAPVKDYFLSTVSSTASVQTSEKDGPDRAIPVHRVTEAYFRGRRLIGSRFTLPDSYCGTIYDASKPSLTVPIRADVTAKPSLDSDAEDDNKMPETEDEQGDAELEELTSWSTKARFQAIMFYENQQLESTNTGNNAQVMALQDWITLATAIHSS